LKVAVHVLYLLLHDCDWRFHEGEAHLGAPLGHGFDTSTLVALHGDYDSLAGSG
jgi:hypothetical protein